MVVNAISFDLNYQGYYIKSCNDPVTDKYRNVILSAFKEKAAIQKKDVTAMAQQQIPGIAIIVVSCKTLA